MLSADNLLTDAYPDETEEAEQKRLEDAWSTAATRALRILTANRPALLTAAGLLLTHGGIVTHDDLLKAERGEDVPGFDGVALSFEIAPRTQGGTAE